MPSDGDDQRPPASSPGDATPAVEDGEERSAQEAQHPQGGTSTQQAEKELVEQLRAHDFAGTTWELFMGRFTAYGQSFLHKTIGNSTIFQRCRDLGRPVGTSDDRVFLREHVAARDDLVQDVLSHVAISFREHTLKGGGWKPEAGGSLRSYYTGALVLEFPNAYRRWKKRWADARLLYAVDSGDLEVFEHTNARMFLLPSPIDPAHHAIVTNLLEQALQAGDEEIRKIAELRKLDVEWPEIGALLGKTARAASEKWRRFCLKARGDGEDPDRSPVPNKPSGPPQPPPPRDGRSTDNKAKEV